MLNILLSIFVCAAVGFFFACVVSAILDNSNELYVLFDTGVAAIYIYAQISRLLCLDINQTNPHLQGMNYYENVTLCSNDLSIAVTLHVIMLLDNVV